MKRATILLTLAVATAAVLANPVVKQANDKILVCYYGSWAVYRQGNGKFDVEDLDPFACTHIVYGFVGLGADFRINVLDPYNDLEENWGRGAMKRFTGLKSINPALKVSLAIGGWNEGSARYSQMAADPAKRRTFIESVVPFLQSQNFDGFDLDWEYPANREGAQPEDKQNFVLLINELRAELDQHGYLLTAAVSAGASTIDTAYDIPAVCAGLDYIHVMAYDFHGGWETFTGHHSPLGSNPSLDTGDNSKLNSNFSMHYWIDGGCPPEKLVLGTGIYGRGFLLENANNNGLYAPVSGMIPKGPYTGEDGIWGYNEICERFQQDNNAWTVVVDEYYQVPYAYNDRHWIGYDDVNSMATKARYVNDMGLGGAMVWSMETDDFKGICHDEPFKLIKTLFRGLNGEYPPPASTTTRDPSAPTTTQQTTTPSGPTPPPSDICKAPGHNPNPVEECSEIFYDCVANSDGTWTIYEMRCGAGTVFNPVSKGCDFPSNVPGC